MDEIASNKSLLKIVRQKQLAEKIVIVDGQPGCGKTMLSPIVSSMDRVELLSYAFEIEFICRLFSLKKIESDAAISMVRMLTDHKLYQTMMGRDTNFRYSDLSSVFKDSNPWRYFKRIFQDGDLTIPEKIKNEKPILNLTTHDLLSVSDPIRLGLNDSVLFIEVVRHPLYMVKQQQLNMERLTDNPRDIQINIEYKGKQLPYFSAGWEEKFLSSNSIEKAIYCIEKSTNGSDIKRKLWEREGVSIITVPFEKFVVDPWIFLDKIEKELGSKINSKTYKVLKQQNVPRKMISDAPALDIYKRCGWRPPDTSNEADELERIKSNIENDVSVEALYVINKLSEKYKEDFL